MAAKLLLLLVVKWLCFSNVPAKIVRNFDLKIAEGEPCTTPYVTNGVCTKERNCDQDFLHLLEYDEHVNNACEQLPISQVFCCQPVLEFCQRKKTHHIYYGNVSDPIPFHARIGNKTDNQPKWSCGGSVISSRYVLTAAHCEPLAKLVGLGCVNATHCDQIINVLRFISHPEYVRRYKHHDIALVLLDKVITYNQHVLPVCPYSSTEDLSEMEALKVAGWGETETASSSSHLMFTMVSTVPLEKCREWYSRLTEQIRQTIFPPQVTNELYCARGMFVEEGTYSDACQGDSGGPLLKNTLGGTFVVGIVSAGLGCASEFPGIYTRVGVFYEWIKKHIEAPPAHS